MEPYKHRIFFCTNENEPGKAACSKAGAFEVLSLLKSEIITKGLQFDVKVTPCGCLGLCSTGPNLIVYPEGNWYYPCADWIGFAKFHPASKHVFRIDSFGDVNQALGLLEQNSIDPVFLGYPYGLIDADKFARVSTPEAKQLKLMLMTKGGEKFRLYLASKDAHDILNIIS